MVSSADLLNGLVSYWKLDETSGTTAVDSHGSNDGAISGATTNVAGQINTAYDFDGTDDYVSFSPSLTISELSVSFWYKEETAGNFNIPIRIKSSTSEFDNGFQVFLNSGENGEIYSYSNDDSGSTSGQLSGSSVNTVINDGNWHLITVTNDYVSNDIGIYVDGVSQSITYINKVSGGSVDLNRLSYIGGEADNNRRYTDGKLDEVAIWNRALTSAEVLALYDIQKDGFESGSYPFTALDVPVVTTLAADLVANTSARLNGEISGVSE